MEAKGEFAVVVRQREVVAAALPVQDYWLPLSNLDLMLPPVDFSVFFLYPRTPCADELGVLKKALAEALVYYYALAGEVVTNTLGEPELMCNNRGVDFVEGYADVELHQLNMHALEESMLGFVPQKQQGVLTVQATELRCGGLVVACLFDHRVCDAYSANMFLVSWAEAARFRPISTVPTFRRSLLNPRHPLHSDPSIDETYMPLSSLPPTPAGKHDDDKSSKICSEGEADEFVSRLYCIRAGKINELQALASTSESGFKATKFESFSAFLWKLVSTSELKGEPIDGSTNCTIGVVVDGRRRLASGESGGALDMASYFGNVLSAPFKGQEAKDVAESPLHRVAEEVHGVVKSVATREHFLSLVDWIEAHRPKPITSKIYWIDDGPAFLVSSGQRFPVTEVDFGWGSPALGSYYFHVWEGNAGYVMPMPSAAVEGDWLVYVVLRRRWLDAINDEGADVFEPLTVDYFLS